MRESEQCACQIEDSFRLLEKNQIRATKKSRNRVEETNSGTII